MPMPNTPITAPQPLISFIIPVYNLPLEFIGECLQSILRLTLTRQEREIIIVDDGSEVSPLNELVEFRDDIIYLRQPNKGQAEARNMGLKMASGRFIQFVDGDDFVIDAPYDHCLDIVRYHDPDLLIFDYSENIKGQTDYSFEGPMTGASYLHANNLVCSVWHYIFKRSILGSLRFSPGLTVEDEEFTPKLIIRANKLYTTNAKAYFYRNREDSLTRNLTPQKKHDRLNDTLLIITRLHDLSLMLPPDERVAMNRRVAQLSMDYLYNTIHYTHSNKILMKNIIELQKRGLYPLPDNDYTKKYKLFRRMIGSAIGRHLLLITIR